MNTESPMVERVRRWGIVSWSIIGVLILLGVVVWAFEQIPEIFPPLVLALVTIYVLNPAVTQLERRGVPRLLGSCLSYVVIGGLLTLIGFLTIPLLVDQAQRFARDFPSTLDRISEITAGLSEQIRQRFDQDFDAATWLSERSELVTRQLGRIGGFLTGAVQTVALLLIGLVLGFYLLVDLPRLARATLSLVPPNRREEVREVGGTMAKAMGGFFRGQLLVAFVVGLLSALGLRLIGLPYWLVIGMIAGFFNIVPLIGPFVGGVPAVIVALALKSPITVVWVVVVLTAVQQIDNHFISPNVMRWTVRLHPVTVMLSLIVGATLAGFWGMLLAVPIVAAAKVIVAHVWRTRVPWGHEVFDDIPVQPGEKPPDPVPVGDEEPGQGPEQS